MTSQKICLSILTLLSLTGCAGTVALNANFQQDQYNLSPSPSPAGAPDGDQLRLVDPTQNRIIKWSDGPPGNTNKAVQISSAHPGFSGMELIPDAAIEGSHYVLGFNFYAQLMNSRDFYIRARTSPFDFGLITELKLNNGNIYVKNSGSFQQLSDVNYEVNDVISILLTIDVAQSLAQVAVFSPNGNDSMEDIPLFSSTTGSGLFYQVGFDGDSSDGGLHGLFVVDNFIVKKSTP